MKRRQFFKTATLAVLGGGILGAVSGEAEGESREERFKRRVLGHLKRSDEAALRREIQEHYQLSPGEYSLEYAYERERESQQDRVDILLPKPVPQLALGCVLIVIAVTIIAFGVIIYLIIQACKAPNGSTNAPPRIPPDSGGTNYGPPGFFRAHNGGVGIAH